MAFTHDIEIVGQTEGQHLIQRPIDSGVLSRLMSREWNHRYHTAPNVHKEVQRGTGAR